MTFPVRANSSLVMHNRAFFERGRGHVLANFCSGPISLEPDAAERCSFCFEFIQPDVMTSDLSTFRLRPNLQVFLLVELRKWTSRFLNSLPVFRERSVSQNKNSAVPRRISTFTSDLFVTHIVPPVVAPCFEVAFSVSG